MLVSFHRSCLLRLLLFLAALSVGSVRCQSVQLDVFTKHVEATWEKTGGWYGEDSFTVTITTPEHLCSEEVHCTQAPCKFNSTSCGSLTACSFNEVNVSSSNGASWTSPFQTAPEAVTGLDVQVVDGFLRISWTNPSNKSSTCYNDTAVLIPYTVNTTITTHYPAEEETLIMPLCEANEGEVKVWTRGGDGGSEVTSSRYTYSKDDVVDVMTLKSCKASGCFGIDLAWEYNRVCPYVTQYCISPNIDNDHKNCTSNTAITSLHIPDLEEGKTYLPILSAYEGERRVWRSYLFYTCETHDTDVTNLQIEATNTTSLTVTWERPACLPAQSLVYGVTKDTWYCLNPFKPEDTTKATNYFWTDLEDCTNYAVCVAVEGGSPQTVTGYTLPRRPAWIELSMAGDDSVALEWETADCFDDAQYVVTWGDKTHYTADAQHTIDGYNSVEALGVVCVAAFMDISLSSNITGSTRCSDSPGQRPDDKKPPNVLLIVLLSVGVPAAIAAVVGVVVFIRRKRQSQ